MGQFDGNKKKIEEVDREKIYTTSLLLKNIPSTAISSVHKTRALYDENFSVEPR